MGYTLLERPLVSVVVATYNWSSALSLALTSIVRQTYPKFEVIVVGDHCTDDSETVVSSFEDGRLRWYNLPSRQGSQYAPNNYGISKSSGRYIAYLGHDDIWGPTHLCNLVYKALETGADVVSAVSILYGPRGSGIRAVAGLFPGGEYNLREFFPPSSMLHTRVLVDQVGGWRSPDEAHIAVDYDLVRRFYHSGARFASTDEATVFKFTAAWRRNSYLDRNTDDQARTLEALSERAEQFCRQQLIEVLRSVVEDRCVPIGVPLDSATPASENQQNTALFKGSRIRPKPRIAAVAETVRFFIDEAFAGFEWHAIEMVDDEACRWTGPSSRSSFFLPVQIDLLFRLKVHVRQITLAGEIETAALWVGNRKLSASFEVQLDSTWLWCADLHPAFFDDASVPMLTISFPTRRPRDVSTSDDRRWLGMLIGYVELWPVS